MKTTTHKTSSKSSLRPPILRQPLAEEFQRFMEYHPASRFSRNLRKMLLEYLMHESALEEDYLQDLLYDLEGLFTLLDAIDMEGK